MVDVHGDVAPCARLHSNLLKKEPRVRDSIARCGVGVHGRVVTAN